MNKTSLIFGQTGQDGSYLAELLLEKGYKVIGVRRRVSTNNLERVEHLLSNPNFILTHGDVSDTASVFGLIDKYEPDEIYNLAAMSHVGLSFDQPLLTWDIVAKGCINILEAIRHSPRKSKIRFYQASSSEMFGSSFVEDDNGKYQNEDTPLHPQSPYGIAKLAAHHAVRNYRDGYGLFACSGILMNHESPRRGENFVTRKISKWVANFQKYRNGIHIFDRDIDDYPKLHLGNLDACRDWGHSRDYVLAQQMMLQQDEPDDFVIATGETHSVREFVELAFSYIGIADWEKYVVIDPKFFRPTEVDYLRGDPSKAKRVLGWEPKTTFKQLVEEMVQYDIDN
jgi:GDPmannose 4,6-dehydratase